MNEVTEQRVEEQTLPMVVASVLDNHRVVINRGSEDGIRSRQRFLVYELGDEIKDPATDLSLGRLEIPKGTGRVVHLQEHMATVKSDQTEPDTRKRLVKRSSVWSIAPSEEEEVIPSNKRLPFTDPLVGDFVKPVS